MIAKRDPHPLSLVATYTKEAGELIPTRAA
jgi:hypothetical protein